MFEVGGLNLILESESIYVFDSIECPAVFLRALPQILSPSDRVAFATYATDPAVRDFWKRHALAPDRVVAHWDHMVKIYQNDEDFPDPMACALPAEPRLLDELAGISEKLPGAHLFCHHLGVYSADTALISFHDAFCGDPCLVSGDLPMERVGGFARQLGQPFRIAASHEVYTYWKTDPTKGTQS